MKPAKDKFSDQAMFYEAFRPTYPKEVYQAFMPLVEAKHTCWDCGTGNGQVAHTLAEYFDRVYATDISQSQLDNAKPQNNIIYKRERAEKTNFSDNQFDLITVAQAIHWFDFEAFNTEAKRVGKNGGIVSIWGYGLPRMSPEIDALIDTFYYDIIGAYWDRERRHIDNQYRSIPFDFAEISVEQNISLRLHWKLKQLAGYLNSWSSVQNFNAKNVATDPVKEIIEQVEIYWENTAIKTVRFPIFMRIGKIET